MSKTETKRCPECGTENLNEAECCSECGFLFKKKKKTTHKEKSNLQKLYGLKNSLIRVAIICFIVALFFFYKGYNVKNNYYNSDYSSLATNAYVGGDAYNYIINGNYFTGYAVIGSAFMLSGMSLFCSAIGIVSKIRSDSL